MNIFYKDITSGEIFNHADLCQRYPSVTFSSDGILTEEVLTILGITRVLVPEQPITSKFQSAILTEINGNLEWVIETWDEGRLSEAKQILRETVTETRYTKETSGVVFYGTQIGTDRESQAQINAALATLERGFVPVIEFKGVNGWVSLDLATMTAICEVVSTHVVHCFNIEKQKLIEIDALDTIQECIDYDITVGW